MKELLMRLWDIALILLEIAITMLMLSLLSIFQ
jgi:hypothetical protein